MDETGEAITRISGFIAGLNETMHSVAKATTEQTTTRTQVSGAMSELDGVTQQNVAMFEETAAATAALKIRTDALIETGSCFNTSTGRGQPEQSTVS